MNIGEAAAASGVSAKMIRYYESIGLIPAAHRSAAGYRHYDDGDVHKLRFVRRARDLGFSVGDIGRLLELWADRSRASGVVKELALRHVAELRTKAGQLEEMARALVHLADHCHGDHRPGCPILEDLAGVSGRTEAGAHRHPPGHVLGAQPRAAVAGAIGHHERRKGQPAR